MTTHLKDELTKIFARELSPLELAKVEAAFLRNGFKRSDPPAPRLPEEPDGATCECANGMCRWVGTVAQVRVLDGIKCCPRCDHTVRMVAQAV